MRSPNSSTLCTSPVPSLAESNLCVEGRVRVHVNNASGSCAWLEVDAREEKRDLRGAGMPWSEWERWEKGRLRDRAERVDLARSSA